jgi:hypothetical protein
MELNLNKPTPAPAPENEALAAILQLELELRKVIEESATDETEERADKLKAIFEKQISALDKMLEVAHSHIQKRLANCAVPKKTGDEVISLAYDMVNFAVASTTRQLSAVQLGIRIERAAHVKKEKEYTPIITEL